MFGLDGSPTSRASDSTPLPPRPHDHHARHPLQSPVTPICPASLASIVEDILEADDMFQADQPTSPLFLLIDTDPVLQTKVLEKMTRLIESTKGDCLVELKIEDMARLMSILERALKIFEDLVVIPNEFKVLKSSQLGSAPNLSSTPRTPRSAPRQAKPTPKSKTPGSASRKAGSIDSADLLSRSSKRSSKHPRSIRSPTKPLDPDSLFDQEDSDHIQRSENVSEDLIASMELRTQQMVSTLHSLNFVLLILNHNKQVSKRLYSEETIGLITRGLKHQLQATIYPFLQAAQKANPDGMHPLFRNQVVPFICMSVSCPHEPQTP